MKCVMVLNARAKHASITKRIIQMVNAMVVMNAEIQKASRNALFSVFNF